MAKRTYRWAPGYRAHRMNAQECGDALELIRKEEGILDAHTVLKKAKAKHSALHDAFEWDDTIAGKAFRLQQARVMISCVRVVSEGKEEYAEPKKVWASVAPMGQGVGEYLPVSQILNSKQLRALALKKAVGELDAVTRKYNDLEELIGIIEAIDEAKGKIKPITQKRKRA